MMSSNEFEERFSPWLKRTFSIKECIYSKQTKYQRVDIVDTHDYGVTLFLDSYFQTSERDDFFYHESLVHPAMLTHPDPKKVLIIGGGDGGTLKQVTRYRCVEKIDMVEVDAEIIDICRKYLRSVCGNSFEDPRLNLIISDGRAFIEQTDECYDIIILDLTDPLELSKYVYTKEFYKLCANRLEKKGIVALHNDSPFFYPETFNVITKTLDSVFPHKVQYVTFIPGYMLDFAFSFCSLEPFLNIKDERIKLVEERLISRGVGELLYYNPASHPTNTALPGYIRKILETPCQISTDKHPYTMESP